MREREESEMIIRFLPLETRLGHAVIHQYKQPEVFGKVMNFGLDNHLYDANLKLKDS